MNLRILESAIASFEEQTDKRPRRITVPSVAAFLSNLAIEKGTVFVFGRIARVLDLEVVEDPAVPEGRFYLHA